MNQSQDGHLSLQQNSCVNSMLWRVKTPLIRVVPLTDLPVLKADRWTQDELADEMVKRDIVASISPRHVGRLLSEAEIKVHRTRHWQTPKPEEQLSEKVNDISNLYLQAQQLAQQGNASSSPMKRLVSKLWSVKSLLCRYNQGSRF